MAVSAFGSHLGYRGLLAFNWSENQRLVDGGRRSQAVAVDGTAKPLNLLGSYGCKPKTFFISVEVNLFAYYKCSFNPGVFFKGD